MVCEIAVRVYLSMKDRFGCAASGEKREDLKLWKRRTSAFIFENNVGRQVTRFPVIQCGESFISMI